jgi:hypothetical protein
MHTSRLAQSVAQEVRPPVHIGFHGGLHCGRGRALFGSTTGEYIVANTRSSRMVREGWKGIKSTLPPPAVTSCH